MIPFSTAQFTAAAYYNDKGQVAYCIMMNSSWDSGSSEDFPNGYLQNAFAIAFSYDANGKLLRSTSTEINEAHSAMGPLGCVFEGDLSYRYEGSQIKAYDSDGKLRISMDEHGNIVMVQNGNSSYTWEYTAEYTYDNRGRVTAIKKTDPWANGEVTVTYDTNGNVSAYRETTHSKDENGRNVVGVQERKFSYENGALSRFDDSNYNMWPWVFSYDENGQIFLEINDLDDGTHGGNYVAGEEYLGDWHSQYSQMDYRFSSKMENGTPSLSVWYFLDYWADNPDYDYDIEKTIIIPSK